MNSKAGKAMGLVCRSGEEYFSADVAERLSGLHLHLWRGSRGRKSWGEWVEETNARLVIFHNEAAGIHGLVLEQ